METWLWLRFSGGQLLSAHKLVNGAACGCFALWERKRIVVTHWLCWCIQSTFTAVWTLQSLFPPPPSNIIFNKMTVEGNEGKLSNCEMSKVSSESKAWMWCICSVVPRSVARIRGNKWGVTASWRKSWAHRLAFISLRGPGELDQLTTFPQVGRRPPELIISGTQWEGWRKIQKIMLLLF